jgi:phage-related protein
VSKEKPIYWIGASLDDLRMFPPDARDEAGYNLHLIQNGEDPSDAKPISDVGSGVYEIRINVGDAFRVFYVAKFEEAIYVLHAFGKKTRRTSRRDIELGQHRYRKALSYHNDVVRRKERKEEK